MDHVHEGACQSQYGCALCGSRIQVAMRQITKTYTPGWVWFLIPFGLLIAVIAAAVVSTTHALAVPYCSRCARKHKYAPAVGWGAGFLIAFLIIAAITVVIENDSIVPFWIAMLAAVAIGGAAARFTSSASPRYLTVDAQNVIIHDFALGSVVLVAHPPGIPAQGLRLG